MMLAVPGGRAAVRTQAAAVYVALVLAVTAVAGCTRDRPEVVVYTSVDQVFSEPLFRDFEERSGLAVRAVFDTEEAKSTGVLNRLIAESGHPQADVFFSGDPVRPFLLIKRGLVAPYVSPEAAAIPAEFRGSDGTWTGSSARARVLLVNRSRLRGRAEPRSVRDLVDSQWKGEATIANPLYGTTTMHAAALFSLWGDAEAQRFFESLRANDVRVASSNGEVKRLVTSAEATFGLTDTDDADEAIRSGADVSIVYPDQDGIGTLIMPTAVVALKGPNPNNGRALIDFLLGPDAERELAKRGAHMPLRSDVSAPPGLRPVRDIVAMKVDYAELGDAVERIQPWLRGWAGLGR
jgi:iron(III) transport system substrate-binding protein